jgi:PKD repeat protein
MNKIFLIAFLLITGVLFSQKDIKSELNYTENATARIIPGNSSVMAPPSNDFCSGSISLTPDGTCVIGTTVEATDNWNNTVGCQNGNAASNHPDVWYSFVATGSQLTLVTTGTGTWAGNVEITLVEFLSGAACLTQATLVGSDCGASPLTSTFNGLQTGNTYYFTLSNASGGTQGTFSVCPTTTDPPVVSGQDCGTAAILCNNLNFTQGTSSAGFGTQEVNANNSCFGGGERQSKWYKFTVGCDGTLEFMITPSNYSSASQTGDDYDWALWDVSAGSCPTTAATTFDAVACNWSGCTGATGLASDPLASFSSAASTNYQANNPPGFGTCVPSGLAYQWENTINVTAGQTYALLIDNYSVSNSGFSFTFGGTASIGPDANFSYTATGCNAYNFTKTCQVSNSTFLWTFGDGNSSTSQNPSHTFTSSGVYTVTLEVTDNLGCTKTYSESFTVGFPDATAGSAQVITCTTPSVTVTGSSTVSGATYSWAGGSIVSGGATSSALVNAAGTYTLTVTNPANACTNTVTVAVTTNTTTPNVNAGSDATITCVSTSTTLTGSSSTGGATFSWTGPSITAGATTTTPTVNAAGTYTLTVTNPANGCTATDQAVVTPDSNIPNASAGSDQSLTCSVTSLNLNGSSSTGGVTYAWTGPSITAGNATATATVNGAGTYTLTVTNPGNGCTATDQVIVSLNNTAPNVNAGSDAIITCTSPTVGLLGSSSTGGVSYSWAGTGIASGGATTTPTINAAGNFTLTVTNPVNGCTATDVATVTSNTTLPNASAGSAQVITCSSPSVPLSGSSSTGGVSFAWTGPNIISGATNASATAGASGTYTLSVTNPTNGCVNTSTVAVTTNTTVPNVSAGSDATLTCAITSLNLTGSSITGGATFLWAGPGITTSPTSNTITVNATGTYTLTVTNPANGCTSTDQAVVNPDSNLPNANAGSDATLTCTVTSLGLTGSSSTSGVTYLWTGPGITAGAATTTPTVNAAGTYTLTVTNTGNGCQSTDQAVVTLNNTAPNSSIGSPASLTCTATSVNLLGSSSTPGVSYAWTGTGITAGAATATATVNTAGTFTLTVTDPSNGCTSATSATVNSNTTIPNSNAGNPATLTCTVLSVVFKWFFNNT